MKRPLIGCRCLSFFRSVAYYRKFCFLCLSYGLGEEEQGELRVCGPSDFDDEMNALLILAGLTPSLSINGARCGGYQLTRCC
jgi:hypothetical protein